MSRTWNSPRWRVITAYLNATPSQSTPPLFLQRPAPGATRQPRAAVDDSPAPSTRQASPTRRLARGAAVGPTPATGRVAHPAPGPPGSALRPPLVAPRPAAPPQL